MEVPFKHKLGDLVYFLHFRSVEDHYMINSYHVRSGNVIELLFSSCGGHRDLIQYMVSNERKLYKLDEDDVFKNEGDAQNRKEFLTDKENQRVSS